MFTLSGAWRKYFSDSHEMFYLETGIDAYLIPTLKSAPGENTEEQQSYYYKDMGFNYAIGYRWARFDFGAQFHVTWNYLADDTYPTYFDFRLAYIFPDNKK